MWTNCIERTLWGTEDFLYLVCLLTKRQLLSYTKINLIPFYFFFFFFCIKTFLSLMAATDSDHWFASLWVYCALQSFNFSFCGNFYKICLFNLHDHTFNETNLSSKAWKNETKYSRMDQVKLSKDCLPQILLGPFLNTLSQITFHIIFPF